LAGNNTDAPVNPMAWLPHSIAEAALSGSGVPDVDMDAAWAHLQERLGAAEQLVRTAPVNRNGVDHAAGMRHLMVLMAVGMLARDGLMVLAGGAVGMAGLAIASGFVYGAALAGVALLRGGFGV